MNRFELLACTGRGIGRIAVRSRGLETDGLEMAIRHRDANTLSRVLVPLQANPALRRMFTCRGNRVIKTLSLRDVILGIEFAQLFYPSAGGARGSLKRLHCLVKAFRSTRTGCFRFSYVHQVV